MKSRTKPIIPIRSGYLSYRLVPVEVSEPLETFPNDGLFVIDLPLVPDMLPRTAPRCAHGLLPVRRWFHNFDNAGDGVILPLVDNLRLDHVTRRRPGNKHHAPFGSCETGSAIDEVFDCEKHCKSRRLHELRAINWH